MSGSNKQILELAKQGLNAAEIAASLGYEIEAVEFVLKNDGEIQCELEKACVNKLEAEFMAIESLATRTLKEIMQFGDKDSTRLSAAQYVIDQRLGLKTPKTTVTVFNISSFNDRLKAVKDRRRQLEEGAVEIEAKLVPV